jgi:hypothetical protein
MNGFYFVDRVSAGALASPEPVKKLNPFNWTVLGKLIPCAPRRNAICSGA